MAIRDLLKKREKTKDGGPESTATSEVQQSANRPSSPPQFTFLRSTTSRQEIITPPSYPDDSLPQPTQTPPRVEKPAHRRRVSGLHFRKPSRSPAKSTTSTTDSDEDPSTGLEGMKNRSRRISARLEMMSLTPGKRTVSQSSVHVPEDLPEIEQSGADGAEAEAKWEERALLLAGKNAGGTDGSAEAIENDPQRNRHGAQPSHHSNDTVRPKHARAVSNPEGDLDIQEAIRLHENGELEKATFLFSRLASPSGPNNALAQVIYGLSLRHGWGCVPSPTESLKYLSLAASNSAGVEAVALSAGKKKGGAAKGELVLAIFELGNSFRHGLGCQKDPIAARRYYETAAELGDTDAMVEVAWCYLEGYGGKKDKLKAATYLRMAEKKGVKEAGNSWIWKEKYDASSKVPSRDKHDMGV